MKRPVSLSPRPTIGTAGSREQLDGSGVQRPRRQRRKRPSHRGHVQDNVFRAPPPLRSGVEGFRCDRGLCR